jgi:thiol:disulfide interchange protein
LAQPALRATAELYFDTDTLKPGQQAIAAVVTEVEDGYHAQSSQPLDKLLIPFSVSMTADGNVTIDQPLYPPGQIEDLPALGGNLSVYEGRVLTFIPFVVPADARPGTVSFTAKARMQICDDETCDPPGTITLKKTVNIVAADAPTKSTNGEIFKAFDPITYQNKHEVTQTSSLEPTMAPSVAWIHYSDAELEKLRAAGKPVLVKFTAAWCVNCHVVERRVFGDEATLAELQKQGVSLVKVDLTEDGAPGSALLAQLNPSRSIPFTAIYFPGKDEPAKLTGIYSSADLFGAIADAGKTVTSTTAIFGYELRDAPLAMQLLAAIGVGLLLNAVPCVLPVLPLKAMSFYEDANHSRGRSILNGLLFSAGIVATFGALALFVISQDALWGKFISHPVTAVALTAVLLLAAAQAFGLFEIVLPRAVTNLERYADASAFTGGSTVSYGATQPDRWQIKLATNFFSGILIAVLSTPCTIGIFAAVIAVAIAAGSLLGSLILCFVGVGMALPWLVLSAFPEATQRFPRTGPWPSVVKQMTAFLLIATAIFFAAPLMPAAFRERGLWWLIFACIAASAIFLLARTVQIAPRPRPIAISSGISIVLVGIGLYLTLLLVA